MISIPNNCRIEATEAAATFDVIANDFGLYYPLIKQPVPFSAEVVIIHTASARFAATCFASRIRGMGYANVKTEADPESPATMNDLANKAAMELPDGWRIVLECERHAGWVELLDSSGKKYSFDEWGSPEDNWLEAVRFAKEHEENQKNGSETTANTNGDPVQPATPRFDHSRG